MNRSTAACLLVPSIYTNYTKPWTNLQLEREVAAKQMTTPRWFAALDTTSCGQFSVKTCTSGASCLQQKVKVKRGIAAVVTCGLLGAFKVEGDWSLETAEERKDEAGMLHLAPYKDSPLCASDKARLSFLHSIRCFVCLYSTIVWFSPLRLTAGLQLPLRPLPVFAQRHGKSTRSMSISSSSLAPPYGKRPRSIKAHRVRMNIRFGAQRARSCHYERKIRPGYRDRRLVGLC